MWVCQHHMDANEAYGEKATRQLHNNATCSFEQTLKATPQKTTAIWPPTSHLIKHNPSQMMQKSWRIKVNIISAVLLWTPTHGHTSVDRPAKTYKSSMQIPGMMHNNDGW